MIAALLSFASLVVAGAEDDAAQWVPPSILVAVIIVGGGYAVRALLKRLDSLEIAVQHASSEIAKIANFATREELGDKLANVGNRFDERHAKLREEITKLEVRLARVEERGARRVKT